METEETTRQSVFFAADSRAAWYRLNSLIKLFELHVTTAAAAAAADAAATAAGGGLMIVGAIFYMITVGSFDLPEGLSFSDLDAPVASVRVFALIAGIVIAGAGALAGRAIDRDC